MANRRLLGIMRTSLRRSKYLVPPQLFAAVFATAFSVGVWGQEGTVVVLANEAPIPGAFVVSMARSDLPNLVQPMTTPCYGYVIARADANGRFDLPVPSQGAPLLSYNETRRILVYAPGYEIVPRRRRQNGTLLMRPSQETPYARLLDLLSLAPLGCVKEESVSMVTSLLERVHEEAKSLAKDRKEIELAQTIHSTLLRYQLGEEEFIRRRDRGELFK